MANHIQLKPYLQKLKLGVESDLKGVLELDRFIKNRTKINLLESIKITGVI